MECTIPKREFFVVTYPGIVKNDERALQTLGGMQDLAKVSSNLHAKEWPRLLMYPKFSRFFHQIYCCKQTFLLQMQTFNSITRRLRLTFRPEMVFAKPVYGDPSPSTALVIRAKQLRNKRTGEVKFVAEIIGVASRVYNFTGECYVSSMPTLQNP